MVNKKKTENGKVKIEVMLDKDIFTKINELASMDGFDVETYLALQAETIALDPLLIILHENPVKAREIAMTAMNGSLNGLDPAELIPDDPPNEDQILINTLDEIQQTIATIKNSMNNGNEKKKSITAPPEQEKGGDEKSPPDPVKFARKRKSRVAPSRS